MPVFVNDVEITDEAVFREMQHHPAVTVEEAMQSAARALAVRQVLLQAAQAEGLTNSVENEDGEPDAEDARIEALLEKVITTPEAGEVFCRRYYDQNPALFTRDGQHIAFEDVHTAIAEFLRDTSWQTAASQYIKILVGQARIIGLDMDGADSMLVQ